MRQRVMSSSARCSVVIFSLSIKYVDNLSKLYSEMGRNASPGDLLVHEGKAHCKVTHQDAVSCVGNILMPCLEDAAMMARATLPRSAGVLALLAGAAGSGRLRAQIALEDRPKGPGGPQRVIW
jgi:hypothetical protein